MIRLWVVIIAVCLVPFAARSAAIKNMCLPADAEKNWPVGLIYMHGLFKATGPDTSGFRKLELNNRAKLSAYAKSRQIRIAFPVSKKISKVEKWTEWNDVGLDEVESLAKEACGDAKLAPERALLGFSNGANRAAQLAQLPCKETKAYKKILVVGQSSAPSRGRCKNQQVTMRDHEFPSDTYLDDHLSQVLDAARDLEQEDDRPDEAQQAPSRARR